MPAPGARVVLHRLTQTASGPIDSTLAAPTGEFRFRLRPDTSVIYLISARWGGIEYFSDPLKGEWPRRSASLTLLVADTSSTTPISVAARYVIIGAPDAARNRTVIDLFLLRNSGAVTRVGADSVTPTWRHVLPPGTGAGSRVAPGSEISPEAIRFAGDTVLVFAPLPPGDKQLLIQHTLPGSLTTLPVPLGQGADTVQVVAEEEGVAVRGLDPAPSQILDGRPLARWTGRRTGGQAGGSPALAVVIVFPATSSLEGWLVPLLAAGTAFVMLAAGLLGRRVRPSVRPAVRPSVDLLVDQIARLDTNHRTRDQSPEEQMAYQQERARLKAALTAALAAREPPR